MIATDALAYDHLARATARRVFVRLDNIGLELADLEQIARIGLYEALSTRHLARTNFRSYAITIMRRRLVDAARCADWTPRSTREARRAVQRATDRLGLLGMAPTDAALCAVLGWNEDKLRYVQDTAKQNNVLTLNHARHRTFGHGEPPASEAECLQDKLSDGKPTLAEQSEANERNTRLAEAVGRLGTREREILRLYYASPDDMAGIGASLTPPVSFQRVAQLHAQALLRLRCWLSRDPELFEEVQYADR